MTREGNLEYWNKDGLLRAKTYEDDQNLLLRTVYYYEFCQKTDKVFNSIRNAMDVMWEGLTGHIAQHPYTTYKEDPASHDELTAFLYAESRIPYPPYLARIKVLPYLKYPQVLFHLLYCKYEWRWARFISCLWILGGVWTKEKSKNGLWDTDSELLALLKLETMGWVNLLRGGKIPFEAKIRERIKKNWGENYRQELINQMLWYDENHPLRAALKDK